MSGKPSNSSVVTDPAPRRVRLSRNRALVGDVVHFAQSIPRFAVDRLITLDDFVAARAKAVRRISWPVLFLKAYALVAAECRQLRQSYMRWPWRHLVEMPNSAAMLAINRRDDELDEDRLCWGRFIAPERESLVALQEALDRYQREPIGEVFRRQVRQSRFPTAIRRLGWWLTLNFAVKNRARRLGTFSLSTLAGEAAWNRSHPTIHTTSLTYGPLDERQRMLVTLICDHRVIDGALAARALADLEAALRGPIAKELGALVRLLVA